jgi:hypothetical protein
MVQPICPAASTAPALTGTGPCRRSNGGPCNSPEESGSQRSDFHAGSDPPRFLRRQRTATTILATTGPAINAAAGPRPPRRVSPDNFHAVTASPWATNDFLPNGPGCSLKVITGHTWADLRCAAILVSPAVPPGGGMRGAVFGRPVNGRKDRWVR